MRQANLKFNRKRKLDFKVRSRESSNNNKKRKN